MGIFAQASDGKWGRGWAPDRPGLGKVIRDYLPGDTSQLSKRGVIDTIQIQTSHMGNPK